MRHRPPNPPKDGPPPSRSARSHRHGSPGGRALRTYVAFAYRAGAPQAPVAVVGTVEAPDARTARTLACDLAHKAPLPSPSGWTVRAWAASACRRSWLLAALARDGATHLAAERQAGRRR